MKKLKLRKTSRLSPDEAKKLLKTNLGNIAAKVDSGGTMTNAERALIRTAAEGGSAGGALFARNLVELSAALGVHRSTVHLWRLEDGSPLASSNGRHDVAAWRQWMRDTGKVAGDEIGPEREALAKARLALQCEKLEAEIAELRRTFIRKDEVDQFLTAMVAAAKKAGKRMPATLAPQLAGATVPEVQKRLLAWWDDFCLAMHTAPGREKV